MSIRCTVLALWAVAALGLGSAVAQDINGLIANPRVFNDHPTSNLTIVHSNSVNPGAASIEDIFTETGTGANRHDVLLSSDGGATAHTFGIGDLIRVQAEVNLTALSDSPRKEAGLRINSSVTGDVLFIVNSDVGEIVAFGGGAPFHLFGSNATGDGYSPGDTILMGFNYLGNTGAGPATIEYFIDRDPLAPGGLESSGPQPFTNLEEGAVDFNVAMFAQGAPSDVGDFVNADFANITFVVIPEPSSVFFAFVACIAFGVWRRNRRP